MATNRPIALRLEVEDLGRQRIALLRQAAQREARSFIGSGDRASG